MTAIGEDRFKLRILHRENPLASWDSARPFLETLVREGGELAPTTLWLKPAQGVPFDLQAARQQLENSGRLLELSFGSQDGELSMYWVGFPGTNPGSAFELSTRFSFVSDATHARQRAAQIFTLAAALCRLSPAVYGWGHSLRDFWLAKDPHLTNDWAPKQVYQAYWLTILGASIVKKVGRDRVRSTPAFRLEMLTDGAALIITSPTPADFASPTARETQARVLAHLRPERRFDDILRELNDRRTQLGSGAHLAPAESAAAEVTEWRPAAEALPSDVEDQAAALEQYEEMAEDFVVAFHDEIPGLAAGGPDSLAAVDDYFRQRYDVSQLGDRAVQLRQMLGAHLGDLLARFLDGRWVPRRNLEESQVILGDRAWLPFLRVARFVQSPRPAGDFSLTAFFAEAKRRAPEVPD